MASGKAFRIRKQLPDGEHLTIRGINACRACYKPLPTKQEPYCGERCAQAHTRLRGAA